MPPSDPAPSPEAHPCGRWPSPLAADDLARGTLRLGSPLLTADGSLFWLEGRPSEGGRAVIVQRRPDGGKADLTPAPFYVRSRVHEYGGGAHAVWVGPDGPEIFFVNFSDQVVYRQRPGQPPARLTAPPPDPAGEHWRFADLMVDPARPRLLAVAERHAPSLAEPENLLVGIDRANGAVEVLVRGADFYASPTPSPDGRQLAWLSWNHPHLPWDASALQLAELDDRGRPGPARHVAGDASASAQQPRFGPGGALWFLHEATGSWNLWRADERGPRPVFSLEAELGLPLWQLGVCTWAFLDAGTIIAAASEQGRSRAIRCDVASGTVVPVPSDLASIGHLTAQDGRVVLLAGFPDRPGAVVELDPRTGATRTVRQALDLALDEAFVSPPEPVSFPTSEGDTAHGFFYPPRNPGARPLPGERPPLLLSVHGGPTSSSAPVFSPAVQFWTTRGFAVLDVNYRGSTGYGRRYRDRLNGQWGVYDVDDCLAGAAALGQAGRIDPARVAIRGGSAGGYTVLAALVRGEGLRAGASYYGISDLFALARDTHKFESCYSESLIGPLAARPDLYRERSPITHADRLRRPVIFFQGLEDKVVPPDQTERLVQALRDKGLPVEYHAFPGEQHGFRRAETLRQALEAELAFYQRVLL